MDFIKRVSKKGEKSTSHIKKFGLLALALTFVMVSVSYAQISVLNSPLCTDLMAGKNTDVGNVCVEVSDDMLVVIYTTTGGWELTETHLWVGSDLAHLPQTKKGNPKVGRFPYHSGDITGENVYIFSIPLTEIGGDNYYDTLCGETYLAAAHAALRIEDGYGGYRTESGWSSGNRIVSKGNWAMYFDFTFVCKDIPTPIECENAFGYGDQEIGGVLDPYGKTLTWGWQITVHAGERIWTPIYMGATQNNPNQGTVVGILYIGYSGSQIAVEYYTVSPYTMSETHLYVGTEEIPSNPGEAWHSIKLPPNDPTAAYRISISGDPVYVVALASVCEPGE